MRVVYVEPILLRIAREVRIAEENNRVIEKIVITGAEFKELVDTVGQWAWQPAPPSTPKAYLYRVMGVLLELER